MFKLLELLSGSTNRCVSPANFFRFAALLRIKTVRKCVVNLHGECFCPDLSEMHLSCQAFSDAGL